METFGEAGFEPVNAAAAFSLSEKQEKLLLSYSNEAMQIVDAYIPGTETSFTIIAFPLPEIGAEFEAVLRRRSASIRWTMSCTATSSRS